MSTIVPSEEFLLYETDSWWINHRLDFSYPGYLVVAAKAPDGWSWNFRCGRIRSQNDPDAVA